MRSILVFLLLIQAPLIAKLSLQYHSQLSEEQHAKMAQFYSGKNVLVTGGCGFIGSHLAEKLVRLGAHVTIIDDLSSGAVENIVPFKDQITMIRKSIVNQGACREAACGQEIIFHLAAFVSVPGSLKNPASCHHTNVDGTFYLLEAARVHGVKRFILSSTSAVYGSRETLCSEHDTDLMPASPYGMTKQMDEIYCRQYDHLFNVPCVILRYCNVYGPRQNPHSKYAAVIGKFMQQLADNDPLTIFGDGAQTRDFVHVKQVVEANLLVAMAPESLVRNQIYNIGTGKYISIIELAKDLKAEYPAYSQKFLFLPERAGDIQHMEVNCSKFARLKAKIP